MKEYYLEQRYYTRAPAYFGKLIKRVRALSYEELSSTLDDAWEANILSREERDNLMNTDVVVRGCRYEDGQEVYLIVGGLVGHWLQQHHPRDG